VVLILARDQGFEGDKKRRKRVIMTGCGNFSDNTRVRIFIFFCRAKRELFFQNSTLGYMTKTLNQIIFFSSTKIRIFFSAPHLEKINVHKYLSGGIN
jgi:hypothetical protein